MPLLLALDHAPLGLTAAPLSVGSHVRRAIDVGLDGALVNLGPARKWATELRSGGVDLIVRADGNETAAAGDWLESPSWEVFFSASMCADIGADAVACNLLLGGAAELASLRAVAQLVEQAHDAGIKTYVSAIAMSHDETGYGYSGDPAKIAFAARMAEEIGAHAITSYTRGSIEAVEAVAEATTVACRAANLPSINVRAYVEACVRAGFVGLTVGSLLWKHDDWADLAIELTQPFRDRTSES